ncbi:MAG TPA: hypothetical protein VK960_04920 [Acidimicrobiia bacterium]|nr:hypothetical protein [Acidimicrobiia bacterium]
MDRLTGRVVAGALAAMLVAGSCTSSGSTADPTGSQTSLGFRAAGDVGALVPGRAVELNVAAYSAVPLTTVEIWADGELAGTLDPAGATAYNSTFGWVPDGIGVHAVTIRTLDSEGGSETAGPIWTRVFDPGPRSDGEDPTPTTGGPSVTVTDCAATIEPASDQATVFVAGFGSAFDEVGDGAVQIAIGASPIVAYADLDGRATPPVLIPASRECGRRNWSGNLDFDGGILANPSEADAAYLYVSYDDETWSRVPEENQSFVLPGLDDGFDFGSLMAPPAGLPIAIEAWGWRDGDLVALGAGRWEPTAAKGSPTDVALGGLTGPVVAATGLDWILLNGRPVRQGTICTYEPRNGDGGIPTLPVTCTNGPIGEIPSTFHWASPWGTHGILQVSALPPPAGSTLAYPGLLSMQTVAAPSDGSIDFSVDFEAILNPPPDVLSEPDPSELTYEVIAGLVPGTSGATRARFSPPLFQTAAGESLDERRPLPSDVLYLRVLPMDGLQPLPGASNTVVIDLVHEPPPPTVQFEVPDLVMQVEMTPPTGPNPSYSRCVRVIENPFEPGNPRPSDTPLWTFLHPSAAAVFEYSEGAYLSTAQRAFVYENGVAVNRGLIPGATVCAVQVPPPSKSIWDYIEDAIGLVTGAWDLYSTLYDKLKEKIAEGLVLATRCEQAPYMTKERCAGLASTAVKVGLTMAGAPPTIPKFSELVEGAKGDVARWLVEQSGACEDVPVPEECEKLAEEMIDRLLDEIQLAASQAAVSNAASGSQHVLALHPGIVVIPEPAGTLAPATFELTFRRTPGSDDADFPSSCRVVAYAQGSRDRYEWTNYHDDRWEVGPVTGDVMRSKTVDVDLSDLAPGGTKQFVIVLDRLADWYLPGQWPHQSGVPWDTDPSPWIFLSADDAVIHLSVNADCVDPRYRTKPFPRHDRFTEPWEIPYP